MDALNTHQVLWKLEMFLENKVWWMHFATLWPGIEHCVASKVLLISDCPVTLTEDGRGKWGGPDGLGLDKSSAGGKWEFSNSVKD